MTDLMGVTAPPQRHAVPVRGASATAIADREPAWASLFNRAAYHALNLAPDERAVRLTSERDGRELGSLSGVVAGGRFVNGHSAPFGGRDLARERETPANVDAVIRDVLAQLGELGVQEAEVRLPASSLGPSEPLVLFTLLNHGFDVARAELNQTIDLEHVDDRDTYLATLKSPARRALKHLAGADLALVELELDADWRRAYDILAANRAAKGRALPLSADYVLRARDALAPHVRMFELRAAGAPCAAALVYRVRPGREVVVAWGDSGHDFERSPMNMLALRVVERALDEDVCTLDLGISNEPDPHLPLAVNAGLAQFKQSVGARIEPRLRLTRRIER
jgi:hypothetical protein